MSTDIKLPKAQFSIWRIFGFIIKQNSWPINESSCFTSKNLLAPLGITAAASAIDGAIQKKIYGSGRNTLTISNEEMNDIMKIVQVLEDSNILLKGVTKTIKNETKEQKGGILSMLLGNLGSSLQGDLLLSGKGTVRAG